MSDMGRMEEDATEGSLDIGAVAEWTGGGSSLALTSGGIHSPTRGEPLLRWMNPQDPTLKLFALDDATESMERESLDEGIAAMPLQQGGPSSPSAHKGTRSDKGLKKDDGQNTKIHKEKTG